MSIDNFKVYGLSESIVASGLPMNANYNQDAFLNGVAKIDHHLDWTGTNGYKPGPFVDKELARAKKLANNPPGTGHNNFLSGIVVSANVTASNAWWLQLERYHFVQIVSCQSKMHRIKQLVGDDAFDTHTDESIVNDFCQMIETIDDTETLVYNCPMGLLLTARISTNYLQLKTIYNQRRNHKLLEWRNFCYWIESLPLAEEFITGSKEKEEFQK